MRITVYPNGKMSVKFTNYSFPVKYLVEQNERVYD